MPTIRMIAALTVFGLQTGATALAQTASAAEFFRGKTINVIVGSEAGGGYDLYARVLAQFLGRHITDMLSRLSENSATFVPCHAEYVSSPCRAGNS